MNLNPSVSTLPSRKVSIQTWGATAFKLNGKLYPRACQVLPWKSDDALVIGPDLYMAMDCGNTAIDGVRPTTQDELIAALRVVVAAGSGGLTEVPAIIRKSVDMSRYEGIETGEVDSDQRTRNGDDLQAGFDYCAENGYWPELPPGRYEFTKSAEQGGYNVGLRANKDILGVIGGGMHETFGTRLIQYAENQPVLTIGDTSEDGTANNSGGVFRDLCVGYGVSQAGKTGARALIWSGLKDCRLSNFKVWPWVAGGGAIHPSIGLQLCPGNNRYFYDNEIENIKVCGGQVNLCKIDGNGTGNAWSSMHLGTGVFGDLITLSGPALDINTSNLPFGTIQQLNIEWASVSGALFQNRATEMNIGHLHMEGNRLNGFNRSFIHIVNAGLRIGTVQMRNNSIRSEYLTGTPAVLTHFGICEVDIGRLFLYWSGSAYNADAVADMAFRIVNPMTDAGRRASVRIGHIRAQGHTGAMHLDASISGAGHNAAGAVNEVYEFTHNKALSKTEGATLSMGNANLTVYGQHRNSFVVASSTLTADRTLTLSDKLAASGAGSASSRLPGDILTVFRSGGGAFTLNVVDQDAGALGTVAQNAEAVFEWDGAAWNAVA